MRLIVQAAKVGISCSPTICAMTHALQPQYFTTGTTPSALPASLNAVDAGPHQLNASNVHLTTFTKTKTLTNAQQHALQTIS